MVIDRKCDELATLAALVNTLAAASFLPISDSFTEEGWGRLKLSL